MSENMTSIDACDCKSIVTPMIVRHKAAVMSILKGVLTICLRERIRNKKERVDKETKRHTDFQMIGCCGGNCMSR